MFYNTPSWPLYQDLYVLSKTFKNPVAKIEKIVHNTITYIAHIASLKTLYEKNFMSKLIKEKKVQCFNFRD